MHVAIDVTSVMLRRVRRWLTRPADPPDVIDTMVRAAAASVPVPGGALEVVYSDVRARAAARAELTIGDILDATGDERLRERLAEDANVEAVFVRGVNAALTTGIEAKRRLLARAVADAVLDDARLDHSWLITDTLTHLDVPHVRALDALAREWDETPEPGPGEVSFGGSEVWRGLPAPIRSALIRTGTGSGQASAGMVTRRAKSEKNRQEGITDFGLDLIADLRREGYSAEPS